MDDDIFDISPDELAKTLEDLDDLDSELFRASKGKATAKKNIISVQKTPAQDHSPKPKMDDDFLLGDYSPSSAGGTRRETGRRRPVVRFSNEEVGESNSILGKSSESLTSDQKKNTPLSRSNALSENDDFLSLGSRQRSATSNQTEGRPRNRNTSLDWLGDGADSNAPTPIRPSSESQRKNQASDFSWLTGDTSLNDGTGPASSERGRPRGRIAKEASDELGMLDSGRSSLSASRTGSSTTRADSDVGHQIKTDGDSEGDWLQIRRKLESKKSPGQPSSVDNASSRNFSSTELPPQAIEARQNSNKKHIKAEEKKLVDNEQDQLPPSRGEEVLDQRNSHPQMEEIIRLQGLVKSLEMECKYLKESLEQQQQLHKEEVSTLTALHEKQVKILEEMHQQKETSLKTSFEYRIQMLESQVERLEDDKRELISVHQKKLEELEASRRDEKKRTRELHSSLQATMEQLQKRSRDLDEHEDRVEEKEKFTYLQKFAQLEIKEKQLAALEKRLQHQAEVSDEDRSRLQQLVLRLEAHVQQQTKEVEEEKWILQQEQGKLQVKLKFLDEERQHLKAQMEMERRYLQKAKDALAAEQRIILDKISEERQVLASEREALESLKQTQKMEEVKLVYEYKQKKSEYEAQCELLTHKKDHLESECQKLQQSVERLQAEQEKMDKERQEIALEREKLLNLAANLRIKSESIEQMYQSALQTREEGQASLQRAKEIEFKHNLRMQEIQNQIETLHNQERQLMEMQKIMADENGHLLNRTRDSVCPICQLYMKPSYIGPSFPKYVNDYMTGFSPSPQKAFLNHAVTEKGLGLGLDVLKMASELDKEYLQEEASFLRSLGAGSSATNAMNPRT